MAVSGLAVASTGLGVLLVYSGLTGRDITQTALNLVRGTTPAAVPKTQTIGGTPADTSTSSTGTQGDTLTPMQDNTTAGSPVAGSPKAILQQVAATHGWGTGAQWTALDAIEMQEAGYDPTNTNPDSKAYGLAQSLGHGFAGGPAANGINEYGGEGLTPAQSRAASMGDPYWQSVWMCNYIASRYGNPAVAEQFHLANNWY